MINFTKQNTAFEGLRIGHGSHCQQIFGALLEALDEEYNQVTDVLGVRRLERILITVDNPQRYGIRTNSLGA